MSGKIVRVLWRDIKDDDDLLWHHQRVLFAYPHRRDVPYIGKAGGRTSSVRTRFNADDKDGRVTIAPREDFYTRFHTDEVSERELARMFSEPEDDDDRGRQATNESGANH